MAVVDAIAGAISSTPGVMLLARESDADHHRSVITFAGPPEPVLEAAFGGAAKAAALIDLNRHRGVHPRIGAADVIPFIPLSGITMEECVELARQLGGRIWRELQIPVYYYEAAALRPARKGLEVVRQGGFERLREAAQNDPDRRPDTGGPALHPTAGATAVGARKLLLAYNINLDTADVEIAKAIARKIRSSNGGLAHVKAMGVYLASRGQAQVSMNLTDFEITPLTVVHEAVRLEAARLGAAIASSEIIGLMPARALGMAAAHHLQIRNLEPESVLESRLLSVLLDCGQ
jgi:glutamate formiminotransferase